MKLRCPLGSIIYLKNYMPKIDSLAETPRPPDAKKLQGFDNTYRIHVGDYRILYEIHDNILLVLIVEVGHRRRVYRRKK